MQLVGMADSTPYFDEMGNILHVSALANFGNLKKKFDSFAQNSNRQIIFRFDTMTLRGVGLPHQE